MQRIGEMFPTDKKVSQDELLNMQVESFNDSEGSLKGVDCSKCKNKGWIMKIRYNDLYKYNESYISQCECVERRKIIANVKRSGLGEYTTKTFDDYVISEDWQKGIKAKAMQYVDADTDKWFVMLGQSGAGKTLLCSIISNELLYNRERRVLYVTWTDFISKIKRDMMSENAQAVTDYLERVKNADILFIDELLKKYNETDLKYIIEIINYRYTLGLKTIVSSERTVDELLDIDEATIGRMIEKAGEYIINIKKDRKKNYRLKHII